MPSDESSQDEVFTETPDVPSGEENQDKPSADKLAFDTPAERFYFMVSLIEAFVLRFLIRHCERLLDDDGKPDMHGISLREALIRTGVVQQCDKEKEWLLDHGVFPQEVLDDRLAWYQAFIKKRLEYLSIIAAGLALKDRGNPFNSHAGIHIFLLELFKFPVSILKILHENIVPDFNPEFI